MVMAHLGAVSLTPLKIALRLRHRICDMRETDEGMAARRAEDIESGRFHLDCKCSEIVRPRDGGFGREGLQDRGFRINAYARLLRCNSVTMEKLGKQRGFDKELPGRACPENQRSSVKRSPIQPKPPLR